MKNDKTVRANPLMLQIVRPVREKREIMNHLASLFINQDCGVDGHARLEGFVVGVL